VLYSEKYDKIYIGYTSNLEQRIYFHNLGLKGWTSRFVHWKLVYSEEFSTKKEALKRGKELKSYQGRRFIHEKILKKISV